MSEQWLRIGDLNAVPKVVTKALGFYVRDRTWCCQVRPETPEIWHVARMLDDRADPFDANAVEPPEASTFVRDTYRRIVTERKNVPGAYGNWVLRIRYGIEVCYGPGRTT